MVHLLNELQVRHDRRLELAIKKRRYEDEHVRTLRKVEEEGVWSWWKVCDLLFFFFWLLTQNDAVRTRRVADRVIFGR